MINKKIITGILTVVVVLAAIQSIGPVMADDAGDSSFATVLVNIASGQGTICWSGAAEGCTQAYQYVTIRDGVPITFTATPAAGFTFTSWNLGDVSPGSSTPTLSANPLTLSIDYGMAYQSVSVSFATQ